jgi:membrane protein YdbS with pleckstrin-like domain
VGEGVIIATTLKPCPFCAESIQDAAIKCRFCGSALDGSQQAGEGRPGAGAIVSAAGSAAGASAAMSRPAMVIYEGAPSWKAWFWSYVFACILSVAVVGLVWVLALHLKRKASRYKLTDRTIDYESGVFSRQIETLQLWRVQDLDFQQSLFERMLGIARIRVFTKDVTDPELVLRGLPASREIFDKLKDASELARQQRVIGLVE